MVKKLTYFIPEVSMDKHNALSTVVFIKIGVYCSRLFNTFETYVPFNSRSLTATMNVLLDMIGSKYDCHY